MKLRASFVSNSSSCSFLIPCKTQLDGKGAVEKAFPALKGTWLAEADEVLEGHFMSLHFKEQWANEIIDYAQDLGDANVPFPDVGFEDMDANKVKKKLAYDRACQDIGLKVVLPFLARHKGEFFYRVDVYDWTDEYQLLKMSLKDTEFLETEQHG